MKKKLLAGLFVLANVISFGANKVPASKIHKNIVVNKSESNEVKLKINEKLYTRSSNGEKVYKRKAQDIMGYISIDVVERVNRKPIGKVGRIDENGNITLNIPKYVSTDKLVVANETPTGKMEETVAGGVLILEPNIQIWKADDDIMIMTYLERDYTYVLDGVDYGTFNKGWNYARMNDHRARTDYGDYKWIIMDNLK